MEYSYFRDSQKAISVPAKAVKAASRSLVMLEAERAKDAKPQRKYRVFKNFDYCGSGFN
jgi:hypothetical protein